MEGVEFTSSQPSGSNNASSSNQTIEIEQTANSTPDKADKQRQQSWTVIGKTKQFQLFFPLDIIPGQNATEKKNYVYQIISDVLGLRTYVVITIKSIKAKDDQQSYETCIWDVPLDIEKDIFEQHYSIGNVKVIKFNIKQLYYEVVVTFADRKLEQRFEKE
ncbi:hypothetical protein C1646_768495 [Rhizophagus diaphanus]|nr:hypothetical protein C1646_768495 [Rhizophagus diaphanus] [Rhizophagus sp. MUCL 43196]